MGQNSSSQKIVIFSEKELSISIQNLIYRLPAAVLTPEDISVDLVPVLKGMDSDRVLVYKHLHPTFFSKVVSIANKMEIYPRFYLDDATLISMLQERIRTKDSSTPKEMNHLLEIDLEEKAKVHTSYANFEIKTRIHKPPKEDYLNSYEQGLKTDGFTAKPRSKPEVKTESQKSEEKIETPSEKGEEAMRKEGESYYAYMKRTGKFTPEHNTPEYKEKFLAKSLKDGWKVDKKKVGSYYSIIYKQVNGSSAGRKNPSKAQSNHRGTQSNDAKVVPESNGKVFQDLRLLLKSFKETANEIEEKINEIEEDYKAQHQKTAKVDSMLSQMKSAWEEIH